MCRTEGELKGKSIDEESSESDEMDLARKGLCLRIPRGLSASKFLKKR